MHRLRTHSAIHRLRLAAVLLCLKWTLAPVSLCTLVYSIMIDDRNLTMIALGMVLLVFLMLILQCMISAKTNCPLCMTPVLAVKGCTKHRQAKPLFGSHRLRVALSILFKNSFRCPYCHEPTVLEVRANYRY